MTPNKILIVDDDVRLAATLLELLAREGFEPAHASGGAVGLAPPPRNSVDLVILDVLRGRVDGFAVLRCLRMQGYIPVLMLTARADKENGIRGLELGADDYLTKPFRPRELLARMRALLRRCDRKTLTDPAPLTLGELAIDPGARSATMDGVPMRLTTAEFMVLEALVRSAGRVQSRAALTRRALGRCLEPFDRSIDTHVSNIRRKLSLKPGRGIEIKSFRGHGYVLTIPRLQPREESPSIIPNHVSGNAHLAIESAGGGKSHVFVQANAYATCGSKRPLCRGSICRELEV